MRRPKVQPDFSNIEEVCDYYGAFGSNPTFMRGFHWLMAQVAKPYVVFAEGAEPAIADHLHENKPAILAMTHHSWFDPVNAAAAIQNETVLKPIIGRTIIPANLSYFNKPVFGTILALGGAKPVYRVKDLVHYYERTGLSKEAATQKVAQQNIDRKGSNQKIRNLEVELVDKGAIYASYVEGTRNRGDQSQIQPIRDGVKNLLEKMENADDARIICVGYDYAARSPHRKRFLNPTFYRHQRLFIKLIKYGQ